MTTYTATEVEQAVKAAAEERGYSSYGISQGSYWTEFSSTPDVVPGIDGTIENVTTSGGEGQGEQYVVVLKLVSTDGDEQYFRIDGYYSSYDGGVDFSYAHLYEVRPHEKVIMVFEGV